MPVALTAAQTRFLRGQAHDLKALLQIGNKGVTPAFLAELDAVLEQHELVKVKVAGEDREARDAMIGELAEQADAAAHRPYRRAVPPQQGAPADRAAARLIRLPWLPSCS